jgi:hypothetical protein
MLLLKVLTLRDRQLPIPWSMEAGDDEAVAVAVPMPLPAPEFEWFKTCIGGGTRPLPGAPGGSAPVVPGVRLPEAYLTALRGRKGVVALMDAVGDLGTRMGFFVGGGPVVKPESAGQKCLLGIATRLKKLLVTLEDGGSALGIDWPAAFATVLLLVIKGCWAQDVWQGLCVLAHALWGFLAPETARALGKSRCGYEAVSAVAAQALVVENLLWCRTVVGDLRRCGPMVPRESEHVCLDVVPLLMCLVGVYDWKTNDVPLCMSRVLLLDVANRVAFMAGCVPVAELQAAAATALTVLQDVCKAAAPGEGGPIPRRVCVGCA